MSGQTGSITDQLQQWSQGRPEAFNHLMEQVYGELRAISHNVLKDEWDPALQTTELVHQVFDTLQQKGHIDWQNRRHFYAVAARAMRRVLIHDARRRKADKRNNGRSPETLDGEGLAAPALSAEDWLLLDQLWRALQAQDALLAQLVELRVFGGFTIAEAADILSIAEATVKRKWAFVRAWLLRRGARVAP